MSAESPSRRAAKPARAIYVAVKETSHRVLLLFLFYFCFVFVCALAIEQSTPRFANSRVRAPPHVVRPRSPGSQRVERFETDEEERGSGGGQLPTARQPTPRVKRVANFAKWATQVAEAAKADAAAASETVDWRKERRRRQSATHTAPTGAKEKPTVPSPFAATTQEESGAAASASREAARLITSRPNASRHVNVPGMHVVSQGLTSGLRFPGERPAQPSRGRQPPLPSDLERFELGDALPMLPAVSEHLKELTGHMKPASRLLREAREQTLARSREAFNEHQVRTQFEPGERVRLCGARERRAVPAGHGFRVSATIIATSPARTSRTTSISNGYRRPPRRGRGGHPS